MLITGARKGIGRYLAEYYASKGLLVIGCSREPTDYKHESYMHYCLDVCDEPKVKQLMANIRRDIGRLDILINNAGVASMNSALLTPLTTVQKVFNTNVVGTFLFCREAAKLMMLNKYGRIANFTTVATPLKLEGEAIYAASKAAVITLTQVLAREFAPFNITVNALGPTPIETDLIRSVPPKKLAALIQRQAIPRRGEFADVSNALDFFIQPESNFITGQVIFLGGV